MESFQEQLASSHFPESSTWTTTEEEEEEEEEESSLKNIPPSPNPRIVIHNVFSYLLNHHFFPPIPTNHIHESLLTKDFTDLIKIYHRQQNVLQTCGRMDMKESLHILADTVFSHKISWARLILFLMYAAEWTLQTIPEHDDSEEWIYSVYNILEDIVADKLQIWIDENGGWEGAHNCIIELPKKKKKQNNWLARVMERVFSFVYRLVFWF